MDKQQLEQGKTLYNDIQRLQRFIEDISKVPVKEEDRDLTINSVAIPQEFIPVTNAVEVLLVEIKDKATKKLQSLQRQFEAL